MEHLRDQIGVLHGIVQKQAQQHYITRLQGEQTQIRNVRDNLLITGLDGDGEEETETTTAELVTDFFNQTMKVEKPIPLKGAIRIGNADPKTILVKLKNNADKMEIFKKGKELKGVKNSKDSEIYVNSQLPQFLQEKKKWYRHLIKYNSTLTGSNKKTMTLKRGELLVDGKVFYPSVREPDIHEIMFPRDEKHVERIKLQKGEEIRKGNCVFVAYAASVCSVGDVRAAYTKVMRLNSNALHVSCGYRISGRDFIHLRGIVDNDEHGAGRTIYFVLEDSNIFNKAVFLVRYYGNKHLGPQRFQLMKEAVKSAIKDNGPGKQTTQKDPKQVKETDSEVTFKKTAATQGYISATSPRPYAQQKISSWGSTESMTSAPPWGHGTDNFFNRPRANSIDSTASFNSLGSYR